MCFLIYSQDWIGRGCFPPTNILNMEQRVIEEMMLDCLSFCLWTGPWWLPGTLCVCVCVSHECHHNVQTSRRNPAGRTFPEPLLYLSNCQEDPQRYLKLSCILGFWLKSYWQWQEQKNKLSEIQNYKKATRESDLDGLIPRQVTLKQSNQLKMHQLF